MLNEEYPLGLPKGSIRAILSLIIIATANIGLLLSRFSIEEYGLIVGAVIAFYFANRASA